MKLLKRDTAAALAKANEDLAAVETEIVSLQQERLEKLLDAESGEIEAIDQRIADQYHAVNVFRDRIAGLEQRLAVEQEQQGRRNYSAAVNKLEGPLAARAQKAAKIERIADELAAAMREFEASDIAVAQAWPPGVAWSERVYLPGYLGTSWIGSRFGDRLGPDLVDHHTRRAPTASEWFSRLLRFHVTGIGEVAAEQGRVLVEDLRQALDPLPVESENEEAA